jgi:hypothetical protein
MKEGDKGLRFHTLLTMGMHRGGRISSEKRRRRVCCWRRHLYSSWQCPAGGKQAGGEGGAQGEGEVWRWAGPRRAGGRRPGGTRRRLLCSGGAHGHRGKVGARRGLAAVLW